MTALDDWIIEVTEALGIGDRSGDQKLVLDLARDVAHDVMRPAAPLTAYLAGVAVGRGMDPAEAAATVTDLAARWSAAHPHPATP